jgi:superfamily II DNA or RNA helicase
MTQGDLFSGAARKLEPRAADPWQGLRWFQREACDAIMAGFEENRSQLLVLATGLGKTQCFSAIARNWPGNVLVLAHRQELIYQAKLRLEAMAGEHVGVEMASERASKRDRIVVASLDTMRVQARKDFFGAAHFGLVIHDEAHHALAKSYRETLGWFDAKLLGVTATPDRGDEKALGKVFDSVAYCFDILQGIDAGYLVPLRGRQVELGEIQLDGLSKVAGDLAKGQLDEVMVRAVEGIVHKTLELEPGRQGIGFMPGVKSASYACERMNALLPGSSVFISGETPEGERREATDGFRSGRYRYLWNCMVATEGFDAPAASLIIQGRPTLSRALYAQMVGRGTRVLPNTVEHVDGAERGAERRALIAASAKPDVMILDFVGNATKHALMTPEDLLGGDYSDEEVDEAKRKAKLAPGTNTQQLLAEARSELARVAAAVRSKVTASVRSFNPFQVMDVDLTSTTREDMRWGKLPPTEKQLRALIAMKVPSGATGRSPSEQEMMTALAKRFTQREAGKLLAERNRRHDAGLATYAQLAHLAKYGLLDKNVSFAGAGRALTYISGECDWGRRKQPDILRILDAVRNVQR